MPINRYLVKGQVRIANAANPALPVALAHLVAGPVTLHNLPSGSMMVRTTPW